MDVLRPRWPGWMAVALAALSLTTGCAYVWVRPDTPAAVMEYDRRDCDEYAQRLSMNLDMQALADRDWPGAWRRPGFGGVADPGGSLAFRERTAQRCMEAKGYRLVKQPQ